MREERLFATANQADICYTALKINPLMELFMSFPPLSSSHLHSPLRVAVVGGGRMGNFHLKQYASMQDVQIVGVVEPHEARAKQLSEEYGCPYFLRGEDILGQVEAVSIVVPTPAHREIGELFLEKGVHCLIEKPLAVTEEDCVALIKAAAQKNALLMVGMIERFNPAVMLLTELLSLEKIHVLECRRFNSSGKRMADVDVVSDLMVHDIDIVLSLLKRPVSQIYAQGTKGRNDHLDHVQSILHFSEDCLVNLSASRLSVANHRTLTAITDQGFYQLDYAKKILRFAESQEAWSLADEQVNAVESITREISVRQHDALFMELRHFIHCVKNNQKPLIGGEDALASIEISREILRASSNA